jgi:hypothetical protein
MNEIQIGQRAQILGHRDAYDTYIAAEFIQVSADASRIDENSPSTALGQ